MLVPFGTESPDHNLSNGEEIVFQPANVPVPRCYIWSSIHKQREKQPSDVFAPKKWQSVNGADEFLRADLQKWVK